MACQFNFAEKYGDVGTGYIHVHHVKPVSELDEEVVVDPSTDLAGKHMKKNRQKEFKF